MENAQNVTNIDNKNDKVQKDTNNTDNILINLIKTNFINTVSSFINEIDLVFDNIDKNTVSKLRDLLKSIENNDGNLKLFVDNTYNVLRPLESKLTFLISTKQKLKSLDLSFLNDIILFNNLLQFKKFSNENKNTKLTIVKYLYNLYMCCMILKDEVSDNQEQLKNFINALPNLDSSNQTPTQKRKTLRNTKQTATNNNMGNIGDIFQSLMSNNEIMNIATDLSKDIQSQNIDPMMILSSLMSGKPNTKIQNLVNNITNKLEQKINNGEINKGLLEEQAKNIMNTVQANDIQDLITSQLPNILNPNQTSPKK
jgi:hypothetical protein